jgi:hypothetical protein
MLCDFTYAKLLAWSASDRRWKGGCGAGEEGWELFLSAEFVLGW